jgi:hypothetical protein
VGWKLVQLAHQTTDQQQNQVITLLGLVFFKTMKKQVSIMTKHLIHICHPNVMRLRHVVGLELEYLQRRITHTNLD